MNVKGMKWFSSLLIVALIFGLIPIGGIGVNVVNASQHDHLFAGGTGTESNPYLIRTMSQFNNIREVHQDNLHFKLMNDIKVSDLTTAWSRISSGGASQLTLDGNGHTIIIDVHNATIRREPLFDTLGASSVVKNLKLIFFNNYANLSEYAPLAVNNEGRIYEVHVENDLNLEFSQDSRGQINGDFAGLVLNNKSTGSIEYSSVNLKLELNNDNGSNVAGFVWNNEGSINHSYAQSTIQGSGDNVAGFAGQNSGVIESSYADIQIVSFRSKVAGFVIDNLQDGTISTSFSSGSLALQSSFDQGKLAGGFVASNEGSITQSYTVTSINMNTYQFSQNGSMGYFGGFVARNGATGTIEEVYANHAQFSILNVFTPAERILKGRLYGENNGTIEDAYFRIEPDESSDNEGTTLLANELKDANNFVGWDFDQLWEIRDNGPAFQQKVIALDIHEQFIRMNLGSQYQFTASKRVSYPPFIGGTSSINWSVDDSNITVTNGLVTIGEDAAEGDYLLRAELAEDPAIFGESTFRVVHPKVLGITVNSELTNLVLAAQGGEYTIAFNVITEGGAGQGYTIEPHQDAYISVIRDESDLYDRIQIAEDAPIGTYTIDVVSQFDPAFVQEYQFEVVGPYREIVGLKRDGVLYTSQLLKHTVYGEQSYEVAYINHGNITSTPFIEVSSTGGGIITPIQGVAFSNNKIVIAEELKEIIAEEYGRIYLYAGFEEEPSELTEYELMLSNARIYWEFNNGVAPSFYHLAGNINYADVIFITDGIENLGGDLAFDASSNHPGINVNGLWSNWDSYRGVYYASFGIEIDDTVPAGDYTVTIVLNDSGLKHTIPIYVRDEIVKSISLDQDKIFSPRNGINNYESLMVPLNIELADGITDFDYSQLRLDSHQYRQSGEPYYGHLPYLHLRVEDEDQVYLEIYSNTSISNLPLGTVFDVIGYINFLSDEILEFQIVFGSIDKIDVEGIDENNPELYLYVGDSITLNATVISENHTVEGFPIPEDITWYFGSPSGGAQLDQNGVFTLNQANYSYYNIIAVAKGGFRRSNITIRPVAVQSVEPAAERIGIRAGKAVDFEVRVRTNQEDFYSTTEFTVESEHAGIAYVDGQLIVEENVEPGSYEMTFTSTRDTTKTATIIVQVGGPTDVEVQPELIKVMPGGTAELTAEFVGNGEFTQDGAWDTHGETGLSVMSISDGQYQVSVASDVQPDNYTITYSHEEFSAVSKDVTVQVYDITGISGVEEAYHLNQGQMLTLEPEVIAVNAEGIEAIEELSFNSSDNLAFTVDNLGKVSVNPDAAAGKYTLTITSNYKNSIVKTVELYVTSIDSVAVKQPMNSPLAYQVGDTIQLLAEVEVTGQVNDEVIWSSSNEAMVSVDETGLVTIEAGAVPGNYTITATSAIDSRKSASVTIEVGAVKEIMVDQEFVYLQAKEQATITASAVVVGPLSTEIEWSSNNPEITVTAQGEIIVAANAEPGTYSITVKSAINQLVSKTVTVEVFELERLELGEFSTINRGKSYELTYDVIILGNSGDRVINEVSWYVVNEQDHTVDGITVDEENVINVWSIVPAGSYKLIATSQLNPNVSAFVSFNVTSIDSVEIEVPSRTVLQAGESITLTADVSVTGDVSQAVVWSVDGPSNLVTINALGELAVLTGAETGNYTITAASTVDESQYGTLTIEVAKVEGISVSPERLIAQPGEKITVTGSAIVAGNLSTDVNWSIPNDPDKLSVVDGEITVSSSAPTGYYEVRVTSTANPNVSTDITIQVFSIIGIGFSQDEFTLNQGKRATFSTEVQAENADGISDINDVLYQFESSNVYIDQGEIIVGDDVAAGTYTIIASSSYNESITGEIKVHVTSIDSVTIGEVSQAVLQEGEGITLQAQVSVSGDVSDAYDWSIEGPSELVTINEQGELAVLEGAAAGNYTVTATSKVDSRKTSSVIIEVARVTAITVDRAKVALKPGESITIEGSAAVEGSLSSEVSWSSLDEEITIEAGTITVDPAAAAGFYEVKVSSIANPDITEIVIVQVYRILGLDLNKNEFTLNQGKREAFSYAVQKQNADDVEGADDIIYTSENSDVYINENGEIEVGVDATAGTYNLTIHSALDQTISSDVTVNVTSINAITASHSELNLYPGEQADVTVSVQVSGEVSDEVAWESNTDVIEIVESNSNKSVVIRAADLAVAGTYTVKAYSEVDERKFAEIQVNVLSLATPTPEPTPTPIPTTPAPTADPETPEPTVDPTTPAPTTDPETPEPTVDPTTPAPTTDPETPEPTVDPTTPAPTTGPETPMPTPGPTTPVPTPGPTTPVPTPGPTTPVSTPGPTTPVSTPAPTTSVPTPGPTTSVPTPAPTESAPITEVMRSELVDSKALAAAISEKVTATSVPQFADMEEHWANEVVTKGAQLGITNGYQDGSFKPDAFITRAEFVKMLTNILPIKASDEVKSFNDISDHWAKKDIELFASLGVINGYSNGNFAPNQTITREEMVIIVSRLLNLTTVSKDSSKGQFTDLNEVSSYAQQVVVHAAQAGIINGKGNNTFAPKAEATRAEAITVILNMLKLDPQLAELLALK